MSPQLQDDSSDSEDENVSEVETSVLLGIPDGNIDEPLDIFDPAVSRIGGHPIFLPSRPLASSDSHCQSCSHAMPLLVQMWCPFEGSSMDRALYVWGCKRPECQRKAGSVRAWRGLKFNHKYAAKLEKKKVRDAAKSARQAKEATTKAEEKQRQSVNPFSGASVPHPSFGLGTQLFGGPLSSPESDNHEDETASESDHESVSSGDLVDSVTEQLKSTSMKSLTGPIDLSSSPSYNPVYLSTISEYLSPRLKTKKPYQDVPDDDDDDKKTGKAWSLEGWESAANVDPVFERFVRRVSNEGDQCVRYDLRGTPLPFSSQDMIYDRLFPPPAPAPFTTKPGFATPIVQRRTFNPDTVDKCGACGSRRVFECQLMPNLINVLRGQENHGVNDGSKEKPSQPQSEEDQKREFEGSLKTGMEWGSCFIFSCAEDCCENADEGWREELVLVQWDE